MLGPLHFLIERRQRWEGLHSAPEGGVEVLSRTELRHCVRWRCAFQGQRRDHRFYELVEDTICDGFDYWYFAIKQDHEIRAIQPFFVVDQDLLAGVSPKLRMMADAVRQVWPRFLRMRTLMVGCVVGEGHLDGAELSHAANARILAAGIVKHAHNLNVRLIVLKEFPTRYRQSLTCFLRCGFSRLPSFPMTRLDIDYPDFDTYMAKALNSATRTKLRRKFRAAAAASPITMSVVNDIASVVDETYPLYLQVYERSTFHFEKLTREFFCGLGGLMPDKVRFFLWRQNGQIVAFTMCLIDGDAIYAEYIGLDYSVALDLHLYHYAVRDMISWAISNGYTWLRSSALNYDPKLHLRHVLDPVDLYVRHSSPILNLMLKLVLPLIEPTRSDPILKRFPNYRELWAPPSAK